MELQGHLQVVVALRPGTAHERVQGDIRGSEIAPAGLRMTREVHARASMGIATSVVAADAVLVEHRLDLALEAETPLGAVPGRNRRRRMPAGERRLGRRRRVLRLVAAGARERFAGHGREPASHHLEGSALGIQRLNGNRRIGRDAETGRTVFFHGHGPQDSPCIPWAVDADMDVPSHSRIGVVRLVDAELLYGTWRNAPQPAAFVDVGEIDYGVSAAQIDSIGHDRRRRRLAQRNGLEQGVTRLFTQQHHVVENINKVNAPQRFRGRLAGNKEILLAERKRMQKLRPRGFDEPVTDHRLDAPSMPRDALHHSFGLVPSPARIEDHQLAHPRHAVVARDDCHDLGRMSGHGPSIENGIRPHRVAAVARPLARAIGVHLKQQAGEIVGRIGVFPARIEDASAREHCGTPVVVLVETNLASAASVGAHEAEVRHRVASADTGDALKASGGAKRMRPSGK